MAVFDINLQRQLKSQLPKLLVNESKKLIRPAFQKIKNKMISDFLNHPVTLEIEGGIKSSNISGTLQNITNLYSFIGFQSGDRPIEPILQKLQETRLVYVKSTTNRIIYSVEIPDRKEIFAVTPLPYQNGRSWAKSIETGLSGLNFYINRESSISRSGLGIQTDKKVRSVRFKNTKYISDLLNRYQKEFEQLTIWNPNINTI